MCSRKNRHIRAKHTPISYCHKRAVEDSQIEVGVETFAQGDITAVIDVERGFDEDFIVGYVTNDLFEHFKAFSGEDVEAFVCVRGFEVWKPGIVFVGEGSGLESGSV
jgi:hypothetical protein